MLDPASVTFVLVGPLRAGNVGAAARALKNTGFHRMVVVAPRCGVADAEATRMAAHAADLLASARVVDDLDAALADATTVVGTTRRSGRHRYPHWRLDAFGPQAVAAATAGSLAVLFGREDHGLSDDELDRCTHLVSLPGDDAYPSFNLAQAVLLVAYTLRLEGGLAGEPEPALAPPAAHAEREAMYRHLERALRAIGFLSPTTAEVMMRRVRRLVGRADAGSDEVALLRGIARQVLWAAKRAGLEIPEEHPAERLADEDGP